MLVEEHGAFRQAIAYLLSKDLRVELVEEAATVAEARAVALENLGSIDVVVSELSLPDGEATDFLDALREAEAEMPVLVLIFRGDGASHRRFDATVGPGLAALPRSRSGALAGASRAWRTRTTAGSGPRSATTAAFWLARAR